MFFLSRRVNRPGFREMTFLYIKCIRSWPWLDSSGWCETHNRAESSLGTHMQFSIEKAGHVPDFYALASNWCSCSQTYFPSPNLQSPDTQTWHGKLIKAIQSEPLECPFTKVHENALWEAGTWVAARMLFTQYSQSISGEMRVKSLRSEIAS